MDRLGSPLFFSKSQHEGDFKILGYYNINHFLSIWSPAGQDLTNGLTPMGQA